MSALQWSRYSSGVANFKSPKTKSVWSSTRQAPSQSAHTPEVSSAVWMPSPWSSRNSSPTKAGCSRGSPPETVTPPLSPKYILYRQISCTNSAASRSWPPEKSQVSGLWQ